MKILIISDDKDFTDDLNSFFIKNNFSTIIYKWLIKAMDNLEEITPDVIIISADEYPRHWKTLVQFMESGIAGSDYHVYLYKKTPFTAEDSEKIKQLKIDGIFSDYNEDTLNNTFSSLFPGKNTPDNIVQNSEIVEARIKKELVITNPGTHNFIFGKYTTDDNKYLYFETKELCRNLNVNDDLNKITYQSDEKYVSTSARIIKITRENDCCNLVLEVRG